MLGSPLFHLISNTYSSSQTHLMQESQKKDITAFQSFQRQTFPGRVAHFAGAMATQKLQRGNIVGNEAVPWNPMEAKLIINQDSTPYLGEIPKTLLAKSQLTEPDFFKHLDQMASQLEKINPWLEKVLSWRPMPYRIGKLELQIKKLDSGCHNKAYQISNGTDVYVIKVHMDKDRNPIHRSKFNLKGTDHNTYHDASLGLFLTYYSYYKNVIRTFASNPVNSKANWLLVEFISNTTKASKREGFSVAKTQVGDNNKDNWIGYKSAAENEEGILCDLGGEWKISIPTDVLLTGARNLGPVECRDFPVACQQGESRNESHTIHRGTNCPGLKRGRNRGQEGRRAAA